MHVKVFSIQIFPIFVPNSAEGLHFSAFSFHHYNYNDNQNKYFTTKSNSYGLALWSWTVPRYAQIKTNYTPDRKGSLPLSDLRAFEFIAVTNYGNHERNM